MASSENNSDDGHNVFSGFSSSNGSGPEYEHLMQFEYLTTKYRDVVSQLKTVSSEKQRLEHDFQLLKKELEGKGDFFNSYHEYSGLKQKYDTLRHRYEEITKDPSHCIKLCEELKKERNKYKELLKATEIELETVLSERGSVLKENQKLYDKNEALEREVQGKLKECVALKEKIELLKTRQEYQQLSNESSWNKELSDSKDKFSIVSENLETANQEIERLKKALDKAKAEIAKTIHDTEVAKQRRDWAISEREKIVQERDSVRNLCDEIRKERDTATSKLLAAIRDKDDAHKRIELLTDQLEQVTRDSFNNNAGTGGQNPPPGGGNPSQANGASGTPTTPNASLVSMNNSNSHRNSHYSSFSSIYNLESLQQYDVEMVEIDTSPLLSNSSDWGLTISGDLDHSYGSDHGSNAKNLCGPYVAAVEHDSIFAGKLKPNDIICQINSHDCSTFSRRMIYRTIRNSVPQCIITVKRPTKRLLPVQIPFTSTNRNHGLCLELGLYIAKLEPNSIAAKDGRLAVGDRILSINSKPMESIKNINDVHAYINDMRNSSLNLIVIKEMLESHPSYASFYQPRLKHIRNTTSCTQTDNSLSTFGSSQHTSNTTTTTNPSSVNTSANAMTMMNHHRLSLEFDNNNHFLPSAMPSSAYQQSSSTPNSVAASTPSSTKSASKLTEFIQKIKDKMAISNHSKEAGGTGGSQEHDAIAALDSVLDSDEQSRDGKRSKRRNKNDPHSQSEVPRGTWPRVNMTIHINETHPGTIVQKKKIRPQLTIPRGGGDLDNNNYFAAVMNEANTIPTNFQPDKITVGGSVSPQGLSGVGGGGGGGGGGMAGMSGIAPSGTSTTSGGGQGTLLNSSKRNSNPIMPMDLNRLLALKYGDATAGGGSIMGGGPAGNATIGGMGKSHTAAPFPRSSTYDDRHHDGGGLNLNKHRFSLNLSAMSKQPMQQQQQQQILLPPPHQQQNSLDFIPIPTSSSSQKSNHSIDSVSASHSLSKSPPVYYPTAAGGTLGIPTSKTTEFFMTSKITKSLSKYSSDNESIDTETLSLGGGGGGGGVGATMGGGMSSNMMGPSGGQGMVGSSGGPGNTNTLPLSHMRKQLMGNSGTGGSSSSRSGHTLHPAATAGYGATIFPGSYPHPFMRNHHQPGGSGNSSGGGGGNATGDTLMAFQSGNVTGPAPTGHHGHVASMDYSYRYSQIQSSKEDVPISGYSGGYEGGTFPRNKTHLTSNSNHHHHHHHHHHHQGGFRIPSNQSVTSRGSGIKISNGSIDCSSSERASPIPTFEVQVLKPGHVPSDGSGSNKRSSLQDYGQSKPNVGELRLVQFDKSEMSLGIKIFCRRNGGGVFVSNVGENSLASKVGLNIGDQLLEVCGINLRKATYELAAHVLRQCGNSITMLVLYNPIVYSNLTTSEDNLARSGSPTPQNSPRSMGRSLISAVNTTAVNAMTGTMTTAKTSSLVKAQEFSDSLEHQTQLHDDDEDGSVAVGGSGVSGVQGNMYKEQPREIYIETRKTSNLGITLVGGNAFGIFVHGVQKDSIADKAGLLVGDQILEFNGTDMRRSTAEHAALEIAKPADHVKVLVLYNIQKFNQIKDKPGDALYIRVGFDRNCDQGDSELSFTKDEVLFVDNTMFGGIPGKWRAWKLDEYGHKRQCGIIPNKLKVEEELRLLGDPGDVDTTARRGSTSARRSFFKRIKPQRSSSRDSKELASFSNTHLSLYLDSGSLSDDGLSSYQRVERLEYTYRPVIILGPLSEFVIDKLCVDFPEDFAVLQESQKKCTKDEMELAIQNNTIADYKLRNNGIFEYTSMQAVRDNKQCHCILNVSMAAVERLQRAQIYPIVLLLRFKSAKQIKEIKDSRYSTDKISAKAAKEMYEHTLKMESEYRQFISVVISGVNITHMCTQIKAAVDSEQKKILWVSIPSPL
ncbi:disks large homolog 5 [Anopheles maculipalpis]|uniref:disks large homolog 5 n=1 Tax=Anopheles maculipalpis TaxID=1496333 RepID=UPI002159630B|nr:disks large homolog 5 [Anopheles maculipalpis]